MTKALLDWIQIIISLVLIVLILIQNTSGGLGHTFGNTLYHSRRGLEKLTFYLTILFAILLITSSLVRLVI